MNSIQLQRQQSYRLSSSLLTRLNEAARRSAEYSERHFRLIGILTILIPAAYLADYYVGKPFFDTLSIRVIAFVLSVPLIFHDVKPFRECSVFHVYFVGLVAYTLPFSFGLMLVLNAAAAPPDKHIEMLWMLQYFVAVFLFIQLIHNGLLATVLWCTSTVLALSSLIFLSDVNWDELKRVMGYPFSVYLTALVFGIITNRNIDYINSEKLRAASAVGGNIAHELRTPLASIRSLAHAVNKNSKILVDTYAKAKELKVHAGNLTRDQINGLRSALESIEQEVAYSNTIIDMLLLNTSERSATSVPTDHFGLAEVVTEAIDRFPFNNSGERKLVSVYISQDFRIEASRLLLIHVLFNLLKNGVHYAQKSPQGTLMIQIGTHRSKPAVELTDTGPGISPTARRHIFERFFTTSDTSQGAGIGLSFCKSFMESIGGDIHCESRQNEYTTFRLVFPAGEPL